MFDFKRIQVELKRDLTPKRYEHTLGVAYIAAALAMKNDIDIEIARVTGLLHDCAKCYSDDVLLQKGKKYGVKISEIEIRNPHLLHGKVGAHVAKEKYNIKDRQILNAISCHTTGKQNMKTLEKIIFIADYIEPNRKQIEKLSTIRRMAFDNLDYAVYMILNSILLYLKQKNEKEIDTATVDAFKYYKRIFEK